MATVASPRPSLTLSSRRTSTSTEATERSTSTTRAPAGTATGSLRRNRAALRDYYGLKATADASSLRETSPTPSAVALEVEKESELDKEDFNPQQYVSDLLARESLEGIMRVEAGLISEVRGLDGEKKALVYDNYSKLIAATETIKKMRGNMDPLTPTTNTLTPAVGHIAETAAQLRASLREHAPAGGLDGGVQKQARKRQTVRWVLDAPERLQMMVTDGRKDEAERQWREVEVLLDKWKDVKGVQQTRERCLQALESG